jgi:alkylhydroperoxidase family enzyme
VHGDELTNKVLDDHRTAPIDEKLRATLTFLEKVTMTPEDVVAEDAAKVRATGVSKQAIDDALHVLYLFNVYDRLADAMDWRLQTADEKKKGAKMLLTRGYR